MPVRFRSEAIREMLEARDWYDSQRAGLGASFVLAADAAVERIRRLPSMFPMVDDVFRQALLRRFPCSLLFHAADDEIVVVSCFHHRRLPGSWRVQDGD